MSTEPGELTVTQIWRYPVKSMGGEQIEQADVGRHGIRWDRGWAVRDEKAGAIRSARYIPRLLLCSARYLPGTSAGLVPHVEITLPDGSTVVSDDIHIDKRLSDAIGRKLSLLSLRLVAENESLQEFGALETGDQEAEMRMLFGLADDEPIPDMEAMMEEIGKSDTHRETFFDAFPIDILTTSSIRHLQRHLPDVDLNVRRFRPNFLIDDSGASDAQRELEWIGGAVRLGEAEFDVVLGCPRCTIIAAEQQGGIARNSAITRTIVREMAQTMSVYCNVKRTGIVRVGDAVAVTA